MCIDISMNDLAGFDEEIKLREKQLDATNLALNKFKLVLAKSQEECNITDVKKALIERGVAESDLEHHRNDIIDCLEIHFKNRHVQLGKHLFPKRSLDKGLRFNVKSYPIAEILERTYTSESIAVFILSVIDWLDVYDKFEVQLKQEREQEKIASGIALDLLKRVAETTLSNKGYKYNVGHGRNSNKATLRISVDGEISMNFEVNLLENFVDKLIRVLESLPENEQEQISMATFTNILHCTVIEDYGLDLITQLKRGGNNVITHRDEIWIPNISTCTKINSKNVKVYTKDDLLPPTAPIAKLKAYNTHIEEYMEGYTEVERGHFLKRLVDGVGFAGHYNRHRFKMPDDFFDPSSEV